MLLTPENIATIYSNYQETHFHFGKAWQRELIEAFRRCGQTPEQTKALLNPEFTTQQFRTDFNRAMDSGNQQDIALSLACAFIEPVRKVATYTASMHTAPLDNVEKIYALGKILPNNLVRMLGSRTPQSALGIFRELNDFQYPARVILGEDYHHSLNTEDYEGMHFIRDLPEDFEELPALD